MEKMIKHVYEVELAEVLTWMEDCDLAKDVNNIIRLGEKETSLITTNLIGAYDYFKNLIEELDGMDFEWEMTIDSREICVTVEEWKALLKKEILEFNDISAMTTDSNLMRTIAWKNTRDSDYSLLEDELLRTQSEYFNMRAVCDRAEISYSTFRGYKNNKQPLSMQKKQILLKCMRQIGEESWNDILA